MITAVIIEPREHELLELVVRNVMHNLGDIWNLHIHAYNKDYIQKKNAIMVIQNTCKSIFHRNN